MPSRKSSRNQGDYPGPRGYHNAGYSGYGYPPQVYGSQPGYASSGYASSGYAAYGTADRRGGTMRDGLYGYHDPYRGGGGGGHYDTGDRGAEDKWRHTYPYVPTSYYYNHSHSNARPPPESIEMEESQVEESTERENWGSKWEFIFSCIGWSVGIGNVWRFPTLAYENGGGSFLIPYFILLLLIGKPMYYMELALGQFAQKGPLAVWKMCPLGQGVGVAQLVVSLIVGIYYNVIMAYSLYYLFSSWAYTVPWSVCPPEDTHCFASNSTNTNCAATEGDCYSSGETYWRNVVLGINQSKLEQVTEYNGTHDVQVPQALSTFGEIGEIKWDITLCLLLSWLVVFLCLFKGIKSSGKVVYVTATLPYVLLIILLIYGCTLEGALDGIKTFFIPQPNKETGSRWYGEKTIGDVQVWRKAAEQMFFSLGVTWGGLVMFGSYNKFKHKVHIDAFVISSLDFATSIIAGIVIFSVLGNMKHVRGLDSISDVVKGGEALAFVVYPEALANLPLPQLWSSMFFLMLFLLGLDSEFALLETVLTGFYDSIPKLRKHKPILVCIICASCFLISLPMVSTSGHYIFKIVDDYGGGMAVLWIAILEVVFIMWFYGFNNFARDIDFMLKIKTSIIMKILWALIPIFLTVIVIISLVSWKKPKYQGVISYPEWAHGIGIFLVLITAAQVPIWAVIMSLWYAVAPSKQIRDVVRPDPSWGPGDKEARKEYQAGLVRRGQKHLHGYENPGMVYPYYNYAGYHSYHM